MGGVAALTLDAKVGYMRVKEHFSDAMILWKHLDRILGCECTRWRCKRS